MLVCESPAALANGEGRVSCALVGRMPSGDVWELDRQNPATVELSGFANSGPPSNCHQIPQIQANKLHSWRPAPRAGGSTEFPTPARGRGRANCGGAGQFGFACSPRTIIFSQVTIHPSLLLVEDSEDLRSILVSQLAAAGFAVTAVGQALEFYQEFAKNPPSGGSHRLGAAG